MGANLRGRICFIVAAMVILISFFVSVDRAGAKEGDWMRIIISTSGVVKFESYWLEEPCRLVIEFKSRNILSKMDPQVTFEQGPIKRITSEYFGRSDRLKRLTFELVQKVPYKVWQEHDTILLDIKSPGGLEPLKEVSLQRVELSGVETKDVLPSEPIDALIKRLEAMDGALEQVRESQAPLFAPKAQVSERDTAETDPAKNENIMSEERPNPEKRPLIVTAVIEAGNRPMGSGVWLARWGLTLLLGFLIWLKTKSNTARKLRKLNSELQEKGEHLSHEKVIRRVVEETSFQKEQENWRLNDSIESLKGELAKAKSMKERASPMEKERLGVAQKSKESQSVQKSKEGQLAQKFQERRASPRLPLIKDFNRTVILRIESPERPESIKGFARNISMGGICFEAVRKFNERDPVNLRLFFYGSQVPATKARGRIVWKGAAGQVNYYGVCFVWLEEDKKEQLSSYINSNIKEITKKAP